MFPLGNVVFPTQRFDLRVFENRYLQLVSDIEEAEGLFGTCLIEKGHEVGGGDTRFAIGTLCELVQSRQISANQLHIECYAIQKIVIKEWLPEIKYPTAHVSDVKESRKQKFAHSSKKEIIHELRNCYTLFHYLKEIDSQPPDFGQFESMNLYQLCDLSPLGQMNRYQLLESPSEEQREILLLSMLNDERETLEGLVQLRNSDQ